MTTRRRTLLLEQACLAREALAMLAPEDETAIIDGRLFVERRRVQAEGETLLAGQVVTWNAQRKTTQDGGSLKQLVLARRDGIVAANKPAAWSSEPDRTGSVTSLREQLSKHLRSPEVHISTRLDVGVSGLVLAATDTESRRHLAMTMDRGGHRSYLAIAAGNVPEKGTWQGSVEELRHAKSRNAITHFECLARLALAANTSLGTWGPGAAMCLILLRPETGHRHQLRIHSNRAFTPIVGDRRYGGPIRFIDADGRVQVLDRIYLHAVATAVPLPDGSLWKPECPAPDDFREFWLKLGGIKRDFEGMCP